jgi:hypothetical protein
MNSLPNVWGTLEVEATCPRSDGSLREMLHWRPGPDLTEVDPGTLALELICFTGASGERSIWPPSDSVSSNAPFEAFLDSAWSFGFAILRKSLDTNSKDDDAQPPDEDAQLYEKQTQIDGAEEEDRKKDEAIRNSYRTSWFLYRRGEHMREATTRRFNSIKDLNAFHDNVVDHLLPWPINASTRDAGYPQSIKAMCAIGREYAISMGISEPTTAQCIHYGFAVAAAAGKPAPLKNDEEIRRRIAFAFFADSDTQETSLTEEEAIEELVIKAIWRHVESGKSSAQFDKWIQGPSNTLVKQVAHHVKGIDKGEARRRVNRVLRKLSFNAIWHVGRCVQAVMEDVRLGLSRPLSASESTAFEQMYCGAPYFACLPLILLRDKLQFIEGVLPNLLTRPDDASVGNFHELLGFYGQLVRARREADVARKEVRKLEIDPQRDAKTNSEVHDEVHRHVLPELIDQLVSSGKLACPCMKTCWEYLDTEVLKCSVVLHFQCKQCAANVSASMQLEELERFRF